MNEKPMRILLFDDDSRFLAAICDDLFFSLRNHGLILDIAQDLTELRSRISDEKEIVLAILDLWIIDKETNKQDPSAGEKAIEIIREKWPAAYIIILSSHLDGPVRGELQRKYDQITIADKPVPTGVLVRFIVDILRRMNILKP